MCNPFGYEAINAHRALRRFAESFASAGIATIRFDYDGTGDSAGDDRDPDRLDAWLASTREAARTLRETCGVQRVWLLGLRLGSLIASLAAKDLDVSGLIAIAPVVSGRVYLRELKLLQGALGLRERPADVPSDTEVDEGGQETHGFGVYSATRAALTKVDLVKLPEPPAKHVLVLDRSDLPSAGPWIAHLQSQGAVVDAQQLPGYVDIKEQVPEEMIRAANAWLAARVAEPRAQRASSTPARKAIDPEPRAAHSDVVERSVFVDPARHVFGVLTTPLSAASSGRAVLLLNAGAIHHIGPNRLYVALARRWAAAGDHVLRLDISGIGESPTRAGEVENMVYSPRALEDVGAAVAWLRKQPNVTSVWSVGLCSGAYHAMKGAVAGQDVSGIIAINPLTFFWTPDTPLDFPAFRVVSEADSYQRAALNPAKWKKLLLGQVPVRRALETVGRRMLGRMRDRVRDASRLLNMPWKDDVGVELDILAKRNVAQRFVFAGGDPGRQLLADQAGSALVSLRKKGRVVIDEVHGPDHTFTPMWSHAPLARVLTAALAAELPQQKP
ncbi:MAG: hypothetical protein JWP87_248 [Labilithrix sp.]|nr:hypothetical protein [Labilithrix sp.]